MYSVWYNTKKERMKPNAQAVMSNQHPLGPGVVPSVSGVPLLPCRNGRSTARRARIRRDPVVCVRRPNHPAGRLPRNPPRKPRAGRIAGAQRAAENRPVVCDARRTDRFRRSARRKSAGRAEFGTGVRRRTVEIRLHLRYVRPRRRYAAHFCRVWHPGRISGARGNAFAKRRVFPLARAGRQYVRGVQRRLCGFQTRI